jgi:hypothetical protein
MWPKCRVIDLLNHVVHSYHWALNDSLNNPNKIINLIIRTLKRINIIYAMVITPWFSLPELAGGIYFVTNLMIILTWLGRLSLVCENWSRKAIFPPLPSYPFLVFCYFLSYSIYFLLPFVPFLIIYLFIGLFFVPFPSYISFLLLHFTPTLSVFSSTISSFFSLSLWSIFYLLSISFCFFLPPLMILSAKRTNGYMPPPPHLTYSLLQVCSFLRCIYITLLALF